MQLKGKILFVNETIAPSSAKPDFKTRVFGLDTSQEVNGQLYEGYAGLQTVGDKNSLLDSCEIGDEVEVEFAIRGTKKASDKIPAEPQPQNPENLTVFTNLSCYGLKITKKVEGGASASIDKNNGVGSNTSNSASASNGGSPESIDDLPF